MKSLRNSRFRARRSRKANMPARSRVSLADFSRRRRPPTKPFARLEDPLLASDSALHHSWNASISSLSKVRHRHRQVGPGNQKKSMTRLPDRGRGRRRSGRNTCEIHDRSRPDASLRRMPASHRAFSASAASFSASTSCGFMFCRSSRAKRIRRDSAVTVRNDFLRSRRTCLPLLWLIRWDEPQRLCADLAVRRDLEAFLHPLVGFQLGHVHAILRFVISRDPRQTRRPCEWLVLASADARRDSIVVVWPRCRRLRSAA